MYSFKDVLLKLCSGVIIILLIFIIGNLIINDILVYKTENENIICTVSNVDRRTIMAGKIVSVEYRVFMEELDKAIISPQKSIKDIYKNKDKYKCKKINIIKINKYNRKNELIKIDYKLY